MKKILAITSSAMLHLIFIAGFTASGTVAAQIASDRAYSAMLLG